MACNNCFNGCPEVSSDRCIRYTGIDIPSLGITNGDSLSDVEKALVDKLLVVVSGTGIIPTITIDILCDLIKKYLPYCGDLTLNDFISALIKATCDLQIQTTANTDAITAINAPYILGCLTGVTTTSGTHAILQTVITQLCTVALGQTSLKNELHVYYSRNGNELDTYIGDYLAAHGSDSTKQNNKMVPYVAYEYYGSLTGKFDATGKGIPGTDWEKIYICNGQHGTPDKRGRVAVGATDSPGPAFTDVNVNPAISGNPTWSAGTPGAWTQFGTNMTTLNLTQVPNHTHTASATSTQVGHFHYQFNIDTAATALVTSLNYPQVALYDGSVSTNYSIEGSDRISSLGKTDTVTPIITTNVTVVSTSDGGQGHPNTQPGIAAYYIIYIP